MSEIYKCRTFPGLTFCPAPLYLCVALRFFRNLFGRERLTPIHSNTKERGPRTQYPLHASSARCLSGPLRQSNKYIYIFCFIFVFSCFSLILLSALQSKSLPSVRVALCCCKPRGCCCCWCRSVCWVIT